MMIFVDIGVAFLILFFIFCLVLIGYEAWKESELRKDILKKKKREGM